MGTLSILARLTVWSVGLVLPVLIYTVWQALYNIFFHPLREYPGPWYRAASRLPYTISIFRGDATHRNKRLHDKYGQIVRVAPDTLSYTCSEAWSDIYALQPSTKRGNLPKDPKFYFRQAGKSGTIVTANDEDHRRLRQSELHAFSDKALLLQESYLQKYTDQFISCLRREAQEHDGVIDMVKWVNFLTTDLIGDLSIGENFGGLDTGEMNPWLESVFSMLKAFTWMREIRRLPSVLANAIMMCVPRRVLDYRSWVASQAYGAEAARRRIMRDTDRPDFMSYILKHNEEEKNLSQAEIEMAAVHLIFVGSETTATMIQGATYLLLNNPAVLADLTARIRSDFTDPSDFTNIKLQQHDYLNAILKEGLRLYPPAADTLMRTTSTESAIIAGKMVPPHTSVTVNLWAAHRDPANFHRPLEFIPERWMKDAPAEFAYDNRAVFRPFSAGPRDCLGKNFAWAEMRIVWAKLVWNFDFLAVEPDSEGWIEKQKIFSLWEKPPLNIRISEWKST